MDSDRGSLPNTSCTTREAGQGSSGAEDDDDDDDDGGDSGSCVNLGDLLLVLRMVTEGVRPLTCTR
jgi:hypothetical protein